MTGTCLIQIAYIQSCLSNVAPSGLPHSVTGSPLPPRDCATHHHVQKACESGITTGIISLTRTLVDWTPRNIEPHRIQSTTPHLSEKSLPEG